MSRHHNTQHPDRTRSHYPERLDRRGLSKAPAMEPVENLRSRQEARIKKTGSPFPATDPLAEYQALSNELHYAEAGAEEEEAA